MQAYQSVYLGPYAKVSYDIFDMDPLVMNLVSMCKWDGGFVTQ